MKTERIRQLIEDEGAVSPVIGVILMVAITVILAAVIGTFVLGLGGQVSQTAPQASISVQEVRTGPNSFHLKHGGSDPIKPDETNIKVEVGGSSITFDADMRTANNTDFTTADVANISTSNPVSATPVVRWAGEWTYEGASGDTFTFSSDEDYTITFIDTPSGQVIAEKSGTT